MLINSSGAYTAQAIFFLEINYAPNLMGRSVTRFEESYFCRENAVIQLFENLYFYDSICGDLRAHHK